MSPGKLIGPFVDMILQSDALQKLECALDITVGKYPEYAADSTDISQPPGQDIVHHRHPVDQVELLENHADVTALAPQRSRIQRQHIGTVEPDTSG